MLVYGVASFVLFNLGKSDDLIQGFGSQIVDGGSGFDSAEFGIDVSQVVLSLGIGDINIAFDGVTMSFANVELFDFNGHEIPLSELQTQAVM